MNVAVATVSFPGTLCIARQKSLGWAVQPEGSKTSKVLRAKEAEWKIRCRRDWEVCGKKSLRIRIVDSWAHQRKGFVKKRQWKRTSRHHLEKLCKGQGPK